MSAAAGVEVRIARHEDVVALAALGEATFRESWAAFNEPADMDAYCRGTFTPTLVAGDLARPDVRYFLAAAGGGLAGYLRVAAGPAPACVVAERPLEIARLYALRLWHGHGVGPALMATGLRHAREREHDVAWLAVWQRAPQPLAFYRKWGFEIVGSASFRLGRDVQEDFVMMRRLAAPGAPAASP